jgi:hypothetical protein
VGLVEYRVPGGRKPQLWRVTEPESLAAEFAFDGGVTPEVMTQFHGVVSPYTRGWMICRRLFGIGPVIVPRDADPDDLRVWRRQELLEALGIAAGQLKAELEAVRTVWDRYRGRRQRSDEQRTGNGDNRCRSRNETGVCSPKVTHLRRGWVSVDEHECCDVGESLVAGQRLSSRLGA